MMKQFIYYSHFQRDILFYPRKQVISVDEEECPLEIAAFEARRGDFISGHVDPKVEGVNILVSYSSTYLDTLSVSLFSIILSFCVVK